MSLFLCVDVCDNTCIGLRTRMHEIDRCVEGYNVIAFVAILISKKTVKQVVYFRSYADSRRESFYVAVYVGDAVV